MTLSKCSVCKKKTVPEVLLTTVELPKELEIVGKGVLIEAHVCRSRKQKTGEHYETQLSESLPFAQYDIHRQLSYKLRVLGYNAIFGLRIQFAISESNDLSTSSGSVGLLMTAVATGTAVYVKALPPPMPLKVLRNIDVLDEEDKRLVDLQRRIVETSEQNRAQIEQIVARESQKPDQHPDEIDIFDRTDSFRDNDSDSDSESEILEIEIISNTPNATTSASALHSQNVVVHIDDEHDEDLVLLTDTIRTSSLQITNLETPVDLTELPPSSKLHTQQITMIKHATMASAMHHPNRQLTEIFRQMYDEMAANLSFFDICVVRGVRYTVALPKDLDVAIVLTAEAVGILPDEAREILNADEIAACVSDIASVLGVRAAGAGDNEERLSFWAGLSPAINGFVLPVALQIRQLTRLSLAGSGSVSSVSRIGVDDVAEDITDQSQIEDPDFEDTESKVIHIGKWIRDPSLVLQSPLSTVNASQQRRYTITHSISAPLPSRLTKTDSQPPLSLPPPTKHVEISSLGSIPNTHITRVIGRIALHFVKEAAVESAAGDDAGLAGFAHGLVLELYAVVRAHAAALGGNAVVGFSVDECWVEESGKAAMGYAVMCVSGDVVWFDDED
ncbi:hypothetical protein HK096_007337 [Nowakowskiella sp. JEL0078]|nr:hypothetical protein HK096_007337 [Nowakowskiella sp. JEL0078]